MGPSAAAAAAAPPKWKCKLKRDLKADWPTGPNPDCYYGIEAITYERAKTLSSKLARKHSRKPERMRKKKNPTLGKCPPPQ
jgi:hypothetical protein